MPANNNRDRYRPHPLVEDFPISTLGNYRSQIIRPSGPFDCRGNWTQAFGFHSIGPGPSRVGSLTLTRTVRADGSVSIRVEHEKKLSGSSRVKTAGGQPHRLLNGVMQIKPDAGRLNAPRQWSFRTQVFDDQNSAIPELGLDRRAVVVDDKLQVLTGEDAQRVYHLGGDYTVHWALFDAVSRLPREPFDPISFTLIDHFDQIKRQQSLGFRRSLDVSLADGTIRLHAFDQTGRGVMPWTYFIDDRGRLVAAISGVEAYLLESAAG